MSEDKMVEAGLVDGSLVVGFDGNKDGENSVSVKVDLSEAAAEAFNKGTATVDSVVNYSFSDGSLVITVDSDKDGEPSVTLTISLTEGTQEAISALF